MKHFYTTVFCLLFGASISLAQKFPVDTILYNGSSDKRINIVIMGDGYTAAQQDQFVLDATDITEKLFATYPYVNYVNYFNVFAIKVVSAQSGATHKGVSSDNACGSQPVATVNNYFGSSFDGALNGGYYHRLLVVTKGANVSNVLATNFPNYDQALIIVNTTYYGGSGGTYAVTSLGSSASEIAIHEVGHSFGGLADEYWAGSQYATNAKPNMTNVNNTATVKWKAWLNQAGVGIFPYTGGDPGWYKPVNGTCKMEFLNKPFCLVCRETHIEKFHSLVNPIDNFTPTNKTTLLDTGSLTFDLSLVLPQPNTLKVTWALNTINKAKNTSSYQVKRSDFVTGLNNLIATVTDTTPFSKATAHPTTHVYQVKWTIKSTVTGIEVTPLKTTTEISLFPNPTTEEARITFALREAAEVKVVVVDMNGNEVFASSSTKTAGEHEWIVPSQQFTKGIYLVRFLKDGISLTQEKLIVE